MKLLSFARTPGRALNKAIHHYEKHNPGSRIQRTTLDIALTHYKVEVHDTQGKSEYYVIPMPYED